MNLDYDVIVVGAGVAGMTASIYLKRAGFSCCIFEKEIPGGQINKSSSVKNYPGFLNITGPELSHNIFDQIKELNVDYKNTEVLQVEDKKDYKIIKTNIGEFTAKALIIATGRTPRRLKIDGEEKLLGKGISYCALCDANFFKNKSVVVIGGSNSALEESIYLSNICKNVTIFNRSAELRGEDIFKKKLEQKDNVSIYYNSVVKKFIEKNDKLFAIEYTEDDEIKTIEADGCFIYIGQTPVSDRFKNLIEFDDDGYIVVNSLCETNIENIYAAGDIVKKNAYQLLTAMNDGVIAATTCIKKNKK